MNSTNTAKKAATKPRSPLAKSRIANGSDLLPTVDGRSTWAKMFRDFCDALAQHVGGADRMSEPERMTIRRAAALECELIHLEAEFAAARAAGDKPDTASLDLYQRVSNTQRRILDALGMKATLRDAVPDLRDYLREREAGA